MEQPAPLIAKAEKAISAGEWADASKLLADALKALEPRSGDIRDPGSLARALRLKSKADSRLGEFKSALDSAKRALDISVKGGDTEGEADALRMLGYVHWQKCDFPMALEFYHTAMEKAHQCGAKALAGKMLVELGNVYNGMGDSKKSERFFRDAIKVLREEKEFSELGRTYSNLGSSLMNQERWKEAIETLKQAIEVCQKGGNHAMKAWSSFNLAECLVRTGKPKAALPYLDSSIKILKRLGDKTGLAIVNMLFGVAHTGLGQWDDAEMYLRTASDLQQELGIPTLDAEIHRELGRLYLAKGEIDRSLEELQRALELFEECKVQREVDAVRAMVRDAKALPK